MLPTGLVSSASPRIASLLASGTELVCALGAGAQLVGRSHECDDPPWVKRLPQLSRPTFDVTGSSRAIDERVRAKLRAGEPLFEIDEALLTRLAPDIIITQTHCEVCAVTPGDVATCTPAGLRREQAVALQAGTLDGILEGFRAVASVIGRAAEGEALCEALRHRQDDWRRRTAALPRPRVVVLEWTDPPFALGNWGPELVELAGGQSVLGRAGAHSSAISWQDVHAAAPDVLVIAPCGFDLARAEAERATLEAAPGWADLRARAAGGVFFADGNRYFNRSGPGVLETVELLAEMLHPAAFAPRHEGTGWRRLAG
jgi:iron complex transport system substrate-binding protein